MTLIAAHLNTGVIDTVAIGILIISFPLLHTPPPPTPHPFSLSALWFLWTLSTMFTYLLTSGKALGW